MLRPSAKSSSVTTVQQARERPEVSGPDEPLGVRVGVGRASDEEKVRYVRRMFGAIAPRYDLTNTVISLGLHRWWKRLAARLAAVPPGGRAADVCCGTGDLALLMARRAGPRGRVLGVDFSEEMLAVARHRAARAGVGDVCRFVLGDALALAVPDGALDAVTVGFGIRNVLRPDGALRELHRVWRPGGDPGVQPPPEPGGQEALRPLFLYPDALAGTRGVPPRRRVPVPPDLDPVLAGSGVLRPADGSGRVHGGPLRQPVDGHRR